MSKRKASTKTSKNVKKSVQVYGPMDRFIKRSEVVNVSEDSREQSSSSICSTRNASLCGETDLDSIISLVREWVETEPDLMDEDVAYFMRFILELVEGKEFDVLAAISKAYYQ